MNTITIHHEEGEFDVTAVQEQGHDPNTNMSWTFTDFQDAQNFAASYLSLMITTGQSWQVRSSQPGYDGCGMSALPRLEVVRE